MIEALLHMLGKVLNLWELGWKLRQQVDKPDLTSRIYQANCGIFPRRIEIKAKNGNRKV